MNEMTITSAQYVENEFNAGTNIGVNATIDGVTLFVPIDTANRHYTAILEWVADGNTITPAT